MMDMIVMKTSKGRVVPSSGFSSVNIRKKPRIKSKINFYAVNCVGPSIKFSISWKNWDIEREFKEFHFLFELFHFLFIESPYKKMVYLNC